MKIWKNIQISKEFGIHPSTVTNYIESALKGKNSLSLIEVGNRHYIIQNEQNKDVLNALKQEGLKHKNKDLIKKIKPSQDFYKIFDKHQVAEIIKNLETYHEIPHKYSYFYKGAKAWSQYVQRSYQKPLENTVTNTSLLLKLSNEYLLSKVEGRIMNIVDIGAGEGTTVKEFIQKTLDQKLLKTYIAADISPDMLKISANNFKNWFGDRLDYKQLKIDINNQNLQDTVFYLSSQKKYRKVRNFVFFLETTIENQKDYNKTLLNLKDSLGKDDILVIMHSLDTSSARSYFDLWNKDFNQSKKIPDQIYWIPEMLGFEDTFYKPIFLYDEIDKCRYIQLELVLDIELEINFNNLYKLVYLPKGTKINIWRHTHNPLTKINQRLNDLGLYTDYLITSPNRSQVLLACYTTN